MTKVEPKPAGDENSPIEFEMESPETWKRVAHVTVDAAHVETVRDVVAQGLRKKAKFPGFRPGKAPLKMIRQNFAAQIEQEALERIVPDAYRRILTTHEDIHPIAEPRVENLALDEGEPVRFDMVVEVRPEFELGGYEDLELERVDPVVTQDRVDQALEELAERNARWVPVERGAKAGDVLRIDFAPLDPEGNPVDDKREEDYAVELGSDSVLPEFNSALQGMQANEDTQVEVTYPEDYPREDLAGATLVFDITVKDVREKQIPSVDDDLAQSVSPHQTLEELRTDVRAELEDAAARESDRQVREQIIDKIIDANDIPVPPSLEARYVQAMAQDYQRMVGRDLSDQEKEEIPRRYGPSAARMARRMMILDDLRRTLDLAASDEDVEAKLTELAGQRDVPVDEFRRAVEANDNLDRLRHDLEEEKIFAFLESKARISVVEPASPPSDDDGPDTETSKE